MHAAIRAAAEALRQSSHVGFRDADEFPEVAELMEAAQLAVQSGVPSSFVHEGRRYWLRVRLAAQIDVFDSAAAGEPLVRGCALSTEDIGYAPGH